MIPKIDLGPIVASLRAAAISGGSVIRRLVDPSLPIKIYLGVDSTDGQLGVLLAVHRRLIPAQKDLPAGAGFAVRAHVEKEDGKDVVNLCVFCTDTTCEDIFRHFMDDLVSHVGAETGPDAAIRTFLARICLWQRFFVAESGAILSDEAQCGLFAELLVLRDLLIAAVGPSAAVDAWVGPDARPQDFVLATCAMEVKCSRAKAGARIPISNEQQLDERPFPRLVLTHVTVAAGGATNPSLTDMVAEVRTRLAGSGRPLTVFNDRLITTGWIDAFADRYGENRIFVREVRHFEVRDGFPRIRPGDFAPGVVEITYKLDPGTLAPFEVSQAAVEGWLTS